VDVSSYSSLWVGAAEWGRGKYSSRNSEGFPQSGGVALNEGGVGKIGDFLTLSRHISETLQDRTKVAIDH